MFKKIFAGSMLLLCCNISPLWAYNPSGLDSASAEETTPATKSAYPKFKIGGVFQARYLYSKRNNVDINGLQHTSGEFVNNSFDIKRMRVSMNAQLTSKLSVVTLVNLADFKSDPKTRVLENAFAQYNLSPYAKLQFGQFRPAFGIEDAHAVDIIKSIDFSNAYYLMGNNGWQSFQIGAALSGKVNLGKVPFNYALSVTNGNGKNQMDNNNGKHFATRLWFNLNERKNFTIGTSIGTGKEFGQSIYAYGLEATYRLDITNRLCVDLQAEVFQALNQYLYFSTPENQRLGSLDDYVYKGGYILPNIRYTIGKAKLQAIEFSMRYEYMNANSKLNSNPRQTITPMLSFEFLKDYGARLQVGVQIDNYETNIQNTKTYDANLFFVQVQCRLQ